MDGHHFGYITKKFVKETLTGYQKHRLDWLGGSYIDLKNPLNWMGASGLYQEEVNKEKSTDASLNTEGLLLSCREV
jgi:hypothetical protein